MATYAEMIAIIDNVPLKNAVQVACFVAADKIRLEAPGTTNHTNRVIWARSVYQSPRSVADQMFWAVIAANRTLTQAQITGASDAAIQTAVDAAVDMFAS